MTKRLERDAVYLKRHFDAEIIVLSVRWYITYKSSYRDLAAMMAERGVVVSHHHALGYSLRARVREALE
jgi:transposase-like protein